MIETSKYFYIINLKKKGWASKPSTSLRQILELGSVLKVEIGEIRVIAPLFYDVFVLLSNLRF